MRRILTICAFLFLFFLFFTPRTFASESISLFDSKITLQKDGSFLVKETIAYDFDTNVKHGIYRNINLNRQLGNYTQTIKINFIDVKRDSIKEPYSTSFNSDQASVKIGDKNLTITGTHIYEIDYRVENGIVNYSDHDELYWNTTGDEWQVPIDQVSEEISADFPLTFTNGICFTGIAGSKESKCTVSNNFSSYSTASLLSPMEGLTVATSFPEGSFPKSILYKTPPKVTATSIFSAFWPIFIVLFLAYYIALPIFLLAWYFKKKRKSRFGPVTVNFDIPKDSSDQRILPAEAGTIDTAKLDRDDIVATIFDLAIRKYIKITGSEEKGFLGTKKNEYIISKLKEYKNSGLSDFEVNLLNRLFSEGNEVILSSLSSDFYKTFKEIEEMVFAYLVSKRYYTKNPKNTRAAFIVLAFFSGFIGFNFFLAGVFIFLSLTVIGRTHLGDELDFKIDGLKLFLKSMDRDYKWQAEQLAIVEEMIPYAIALGYIDKFMEQLKIIKPDYNPSWYSGNIAFYAISSNMFSSMSSNFSSVAPSSSSGFSGGGFSGGGFGGGGGGSW